MTVYKYVYFDDIESINRDYDRYFNLQDAISDINTAAIYGNLDKIDQIIEKFKDEPLFNINNNVYNMSSIHHAADKNQPIILKYLLKKCGGDPNIYIKFTPLDMACIKLNLNCIMILLKAGADPMKMKEPLNFTRPEIVEYLESKSHFTKSSYKNQ